jgi:alkylation response protein AidB-like acyl-CoA dehydrogenase
MLTWKSAWLIDLGKRNTTEAAVAKAYARTPPVLNAVDAVQVFGGNGYSREYPVEKLMRDSQDLPDLRRHNADSEEHHPARTLQVSERW